MNLAVKLSPSLGARLAVVLIGIVLSGHAAAATYKWVDESGVTHYGENPPAAAKARELSIRRSSPAPSDGSSPGSRTVQDLEREFQQRRAERLEREKKEVEVAKAKELARRKCDSAQRRLAALTSGRRVVYRDGSGNHLQIDGALRSSETRRALEEIKAHC